MIDDDHYPIEETRQVTDSALKMAFTITIRHGSYDRNEQGDLLLGVEDRNGVRHDLPYDESTWQDVCPGVQVSYTETATRYQYGGGNQTKKTKVRVDRTACPVLLLAMHVAEYTCDDDEEFNEYSNRPYAIRLVEPKPSGKQETSPQA